MQMTKPELPGYEMLEMLGEDDGMTMWKARQISLDRFVVIKILAVTASTNSESLAQLRREATAAARLKNPGIVQVFDAGEFGPFAYIVLEYIEGRSVCKQLNLVSVMSEDEALAIIQWVALALQYAWKEHRVIHCDIKPDNIILSETGDVRVGNLGIAQVLNAMSAGGDVGDFVGTPNYASPEYIGNKEALDCRTDIYSLGATFYQLVTGVPPFGHLEPAAILEQQLLGHLEDPRDLNPNISDAVTSVIHKMMAKNLTDRYADWRALLKDLHALKKQVPLTCPRCPFGHSTVRLSRPFVLPPPPPEEKPVAPAPPAAKKQIRINKTDLEKTKKQRSRGSSGCLFKLLFLVLLGTGIFAAAQYTALGPVLRTYLENGLDYIDYYLHGASASPQQEQRLADQPHPQAPIPLPPTVAPAVEPPASAPIPAQPADWKSDPSYTQGLELYREARRIYQDYITTRKNPALLGEAEEKCREAVDLLKACRDRLPPQAGIQPIIDQCYHLISDCHHARPLDL
ncbi:MAG: protein kinase [Kiritimatiellae bacterium]|nr:protein kinase [Kiritimatiellia bacterium]